MKAKLPAVLLVLTALLVALKLGGPLAAWPWGAVLAFVWVPVAFVVSITALIVLAAAISAAVLKVRERREGRR